MNQKIKFLRETLGLTEKEISSFLNISSYKYTSFEKAMTIIPCDILILLSKIYGINIEMLIDSKFDNQDLLFELKSQGIIGEKNILEKLKQNLLQDNIKLTYRSVKKIKTTYQENIIYFLKELTCKKLLQVAFTPRVGLEPTTLRLTAECSTIELSRII